MKRTFPALSLVAFATIFSSCATQKQVEIRPLGTVSVRVASTSVFEAEGRAHLALGDAGLALESFRRAVTQQPDNVAALRGIAAAYEMMGRPDLSRPMFERALALAPRDTVTLTALASSMTDDGQLAQAAAVRREIASAGDRPAPAPVLTIALSAATPVEAPAPPPAGPRLERLSLGEVALVTTASVARFVPIPAATPRLAALPSIPQPSIRLLNAARRQGLAAATRDWLAERGWRRIAIGDAPRPVAVSHLLYPVGSERLARRLAAQFGIAARPGPVSQAAILVILGQSSASGRPRTLRS